MCGLAATYVRHACAITVLVYVCLCLLRAGSTGYVRPHVGYNNQVDGMPDVPNLLPGQEDDGGSDCDFDVSAALAT